MAARKNESVLRYLNAAVLAIAAWVVFQKVPFYPDWLELGLAATIGVLALFSAGTAAIVFVCLLSLPLIAAEFVTGMFFLIAGLVATQYLTTGRAGGFILLIIGLAAIPLHAEWAVVAVAGLLLGRNRGALTAVAMVLALILIGAAVGVPVIGTISTGGSAPGIVTLSAPPTDPLTFSWLVPALKHADPLKLWKAFTGVRQPLLLVCEIVLWGVAGAMGSLFARPKQKLMALAGPGFAVLALAAGQMGLDLVFGKPVGMPTLLSAAGVSLPLALLVAAVSVWLFPFEAARPRVSAGARERDVDELLRVIASAEDELATRHKTEAVVLITDMKSFSAMTEEIGSVESAKIVQRHRDLLLPIIAKHNGKGGPTGGDGLVACFRAPADAVHAAMAIQAALDGYTGSDRSPHELSVRVGIASGEVVVDAGGVPFLGAALNLAARVMDLADGGRIMVTSYVAATSSLPAERLFRQGEFKLKNIAEVIPVVEVLWRDGQAGQEIRAS